MSTLEVSLRGKVALVTGAGSGLGEVTARVLAEAGACVSAVDVRRAEAERVAQAINQEGEARHLSLEVEHCRASAPFPRAIALEADVSNWEQASRAVEATREAWGRVDVAVNNAGIDFTLPVTELTVEQWQRVIGVNLTAAFLISKAAFPIMMKQGGGHIVNISSTAGKRGWSNASAYCASKFGLVGFTQAIVAEGRPYGIRASLIVPGGMRTHFFDRFDPPPDPRNLNDPYNVARAIAFIVSQPPDSVIQELMVCSINETSWP